MSILRSSIGYQLNFFCLLKVNEWTCSFIAFQDANSILKRIEPEQLILPASYIDVKMRDEDQFSVLDEGVESIIICPVCAARDLNYS